MSPRFILLLTLFIYPLITVSAEDFVIKTPEQLEWIRAEGRPGIAMVYLYGHPSKEGLYILRARFASGVMSMPHSHDKDRYITVIQGTWYAGTQRMFDVNATVPLKPGSFMIHPAGAVHFDGAKVGEVIVEIRGMGPVSTDFVKD